MIAPTRQQLHKFVNNHFNDDELETFCFLYFPEVREEHFNRGMGINRKAIELIDYCERRDLTEKLLVVLEQERGNLYRKLFDSYQNKAATPPHNPQQRLVNHLSDDTDLTGLTIGHKESLKKMATDLALILEQAEQSNTLSELLDISQQLTSEINLEQSLSFLLKKTMSALATVDAISVYYTDRPTGQMICILTPGLDEKPVKIVEIQTTNIIIKKVWESNRPAFFQNTLSDSIIHEMFPTTNGLQSIAGFPLKMGEDRVGCMLFGYSSQHKFSEVEQNILISFAQLATLAILRFSLQHEVAQWQANLDKVGRITPIISASFGSGADIFAVIVKEIKLAFPMADYVCVIKKNEEVLGTLNIIINDDFYAAEALPRNEDPFINMERRGVDTQVFATGQSVLVPDVQLDQNYLPRIITTKSKLCVPVKLEHKTEYVLVLESTQLRAFRPDDMRVLEMLAEHIGFALQNEEQYVKAVRQKVGERTAMMATGLIHDINSAVASIPDLVDELDEKIDRGKDFSFPLADLRRNAEMTGRISGRLREFVITGKYEPAQVDLQAIIKSAVNISKSKEPPYVQTKVRIADDVPEIRADELWLQLLIKNLLVNAYRAIPAETEGLVQITVTTEPENIVLKVRDNGKGIAPEALKEIFDFGVTTKEGIGKMQGVGLYHSRLIVETHEGDLSVESVLGEWTEFTVRLPFVSPAAIEFKTSQLQ